MATITMVITEGKDQPLKCPTLAWRQQPQLA
jgi:hypothetical protein